MAIQHSTRPTVCTATAVTSIHRSHNRSSSWLEEQPHPAWSICIRQAACRRWPRSQSSRCHASGDARDAPAAVEDPKPQPLWSVAWAPWTTAQLLSTFWAGSLAIAAVGELAAAALSASTVTTVDPAVRAEASLAIELLQLLLLLTLLQQLLRPHLPLPSPWFKFELTPEAAGRGVVAGAAAFTTVGATLWAIGALTAAGTVHEGGTTAAVISAPAVLPAAAAATRVVATCVVTPLLEETLFRGFLLPCLCAAMPAPAAVALSAAIFSASHLQPANAEALLVLGAVLGSATLQARGNLAVPMVAHGLYNAAVLLGASLLAGQAAEGSLPPVDTTAVL